MYKEKLKAFLIHFALSVILVSLVVLAIIYFWYPLDYLSVTNFKEIATLIIAIDLVMGPVLTFVIFNKNKKSLRFDLAVIAALQLSALAYGSYFLYQGHPVYLTYAKGGFSLVNAKLAEPNKAKFDEYKISKLQTAKLAFAEFPTNKKEYDKLLTESMSGGADIDERTDLYKPYKEHIEDVLSLTLNSEHIFRDEKVKENTQSFLKEFGNNMDDFAFLPLEGVAKDIIIVLDNVSAQPVTTINIDPWKYTKK